MKYLCLAILLFTFCNKNERINSYKEKDFVLYQKEVRLKKNNYDLAFVGYVILSKENEFMFSDTKNSSLNVFDFEGNFKFEVGNKGAGPGEFSSISAIGYVDEMYVVSDPAKDMLKYYDYKGNFLNELSDISRKKYSVSSRKVYASKYGAILAMTELDKKPYNLHESPVLFSLDNENIKIAKYPKELVYLGFRDIFPFVNIDENDAYIIYNELALIERWDINKNELIVKKTIENGFKVDNARIKLDSYYDEEKYLRDRQKYSIISDTFIYKNKLYILVYENVKLKNSNSPIESLETILYEYDKKTLDFIRKVELNYSVSGIINDKVISINYDNSKGGYFLRVGNLIE